jgi:hypothetical protein
MVTNISKPLERIDCRRGPFERCQICYNVCLKALSKLLRKEEVERRSSTRASANQARRASEGPKAF